MVKKLICFGVILIMVITLIGCGINGGNNEPKAGTFEGLSYETEQQICEAYYEWRHADGVSKDVKILHYWGTYNGYPAVEMRGGWGFGYFLFDGVYFRSSVVFEILIFKDNKFVDFIDAYNDGFLTREDLRGLQTERLNWDIRAGFEDEMLDARERTIWNGNIDEDFDDQTIIVTILKQFSNFSFKCALEKRKTLNDSDLFWESGTGDFKSINAISVDKISGDRPDYREEIREEWEAYRQVLEIKIANKGKQNVIDAIRKLEDFDFVQSATPKYFE